MRMHLNTESFLKFLKVLIIPFNFTHKLRAAKSILNILDSEF